MVIYMGHLYIYIGNFVSKWLLGALNTVIQGRFSDMIARISVAETAHRKHITRNLHNNRTRSDTNQHIFTQTLDTKR